MVHWTTHTIFWFKRLWFC